MNRRRTYRPTIESTYAMGLAYSLLGQVAGLERKPPVTLFFLALNAAIFLLPYIPAFIDVPPEFNGVYEEALYWTTIRRACLIPARVVLYGGELYRIVLSTLVHADSLHLMYNMMSFLYKGAVLEALLGSLHMFVIIVYLMLSSSLMYVLTAIIAAESNVNSSIMYNCCVGFSGVIFGLKVLVNSDEAYASHAENIFNFSLPKETVWAELILASLSAPGVSFLGHLCGIMAGYVYLYIARATGFMKQGRTSARRGGWHND